MSDSGEQTHGSHVRRLTSQVVIVTGAAKGIGRAIAWRCAAEGASVVLVDREKATLAETVDALTQEFRSDANVDYTMVTGDIAEQSTIELMVDTAMEKHDQLDGLVNNAGIFGAYQRFENNSLDAFEQIVAVNMRSVWMAIKKAKPAMLSSGNGGAIVNIA